MSSLALQIKIKILEYSVETLRKLKRLKFSRQFHILILRFCEFLRAYARYGT